MKFNGDIIITDPCYVINHKRELYRPETSKYFTCEFKDNPKLFDEQRKKYDKAVKAWNETYPDHWELCEYGQAMQKLGINKYLTRDTEYGDWSCTTFEKNTNKILGHFCADAGLVSVFLLEDILNYNPSFHYHINKPWTTTLIERFNGDIQIVSTNDGVKVIGVGNINFYTSQTGF